VSGQHHLRRELHRVRGMHKNGFSDRQIAKRCGLPVATVRAVLKGRRAT
jgi:hypothetical protein